MDTSGASSTSRMPFSGPAAAARNAALTSSADVFLLELRDQVDHRHVRRRHAHGDAVELALQLRQHLAHGRGRAGGGRDHRQSGRARAAQVLVRQVEQVLVVRVGVDRRHPAADDAELLVQHLGKRRQAVGRARRVADDVVRRRIVLVGVDAQDQREVGFLGRRRDDDLLGARVEVELRLLAVGEQARGLEHDVDAEVLPRQLAGVADRQHLEAVAADGDGVARGLHVLRQVAENRVVLEQVRQGLRVREVVDRHEIEFLLAEGGAQDVAADPPEPVDTDFQTHELSPPRVLSNTAAVVSGSSGNRKRRL